VKQKPLQASGRRGVDRLQSCAFIGAGGPGQSPAEFSMTREGMDMCGTRYAALRSQRVGTARRYRSTASGILPARGPIKGHQQSCVLRRPMPGCNVGALAISEVPHAKG